ncbi:hypothetical protein BESB_035570 [Besnoitia besnoiti]|uniref:Uncharacterized protein n=1 Tax=Besnoitia besnoiti TaxID=94643 RepID=A0A2A9MGR2_BESBE|nr:hypothetical protein BESB_035570 [Besnoitia besnoiti]PFH37099.1 hypothetical protein BESB_035570 [Besnoitia besnoiti]
MAKKRKLENALRLAIRKRSSQPQTDYSRYSPQVSSLQNSENPSEEDAGESCTYTGRFPFPRFDVRWVSTEALLHPFAPGS